jgi:hypothetical protein
MSEEKRIELTLPFVSSIVREVLGVEFGRASVGQEYALRSDRTVDKRNMQRCRVVSGAIVLRNRLNAASPSR